MPFLQRTIEPKFLSRTSLWDEEGKPRVSDSELEAVTNNTLSNALRQLASLVLVADDIFNDLGTQLRALNQRSEVLKDRIRNVDDKVAAYDPKKVTVPESDICTFALRKDHYAAKQTPETNLFTATTRPKALQDLYAAATKTPVNLMRQMDRWRRDGHRSSRFFLCTPVLGQKRRKIRNRIDIEIETSMPAVVQELRRWTSSEALGDITVTPDCANRIAPNVSVTDGEATDGTIASDEEGIDHKLPSPEEQLQVVALKFPAEIVAVDISGRSFDRMSLQRRSLLHGEAAAKVDLDPNSLRRRTRTRKPRNRRRNTIAGTDQKEIQDALTAGEEPSPSANTEPEPVIGAVGRSKSSDLLRSNNKKDSPENKKSHFNTLKQWGKNRYDRFMNKSDKENNKSNNKDDIDDFNTPIYETVTMKRRRNIDKEKKSHERNPSVSSSEKSSINLPLTTSVMNIAVKLRESSAQRRLRRSGGNKDEPHSSSGNWSASSESGRASIGSEITSTTQPKSTTSTATSNNSLNQPPSSINSRRKFNNLNPSASSSVTSEGTLTPDIIHDLHEDGDSVYSCDTEGYYTSFHMDSGLKTLKEEELPATPLHSTSAFSTSNTTVLTAENEYELFGKGSTSTTTSSAGTVCTTLRASESSRSISGPVVPERKSSLNKTKNKNQEDDDGFIDKTGTVKRSPATHKTGDVSPDSGHNTSSSPIESINSPNGIRSGSEFEFSESSDMEGPERIERIRIKTTINSSRIPSMCVITPPHSDDESVKSATQNKPDRTKLDLNIKSRSDPNYLKSDTENIQRIIANTVNGVSKLQLINVNLESGYATVETIEANNKAIRAPSPSGGTMIVNPPIDNKVSPQTQPIIKATLMPFNNMLGKLKSNLANFASKRDRSKSPRRNEALDAILSESGDYVTLADVRNNNEKAMPKPEQIYENTPNSPKILEKTEYVSLNELPCNETSSNTSDSLERKRRQGARVTLDAEGKVVYSSDSLRRRKGAHTTFEPGPFVKATKSPNQSPLPIHRTPIAVRPVVSQNPDPTTGKLVIRASSGTAEIIRKPPSTIVAPRPMSPKSTSRGAYVHMQDTRPLSPTQEKERVPSPSSGIMYPPAYGSHQSSYQEEFYHFEHFDEVDSRRRPYVENQFANITKYQTLPSRKTQYLQRDLNPERSVTPDITRGLEKIYEPQHFSRNAAVGNLLQQRLGIPVSMPEIGNFNKVPYTSETVDDSYESLRISPIDPRNAGGFHSSTPSSKNMINLESKLLSPKKSTMTNEELYAVIHKSKKKMNIETEDENRTSPVTVTEQLRTKSPETGYIGDKSRTRLSWSPNKGEYVDFNSDIDKSPPNTSRSRQSWACSDRKGGAQTSRLDFKKLLLQKSTALAPSTKKLSAVEQLKLSKQQIQQQQQQQQTPKPQSMNILELSGSPRSLMVNRRLNNPASPKTPDKPKPPPKLMSPRSHWRFNSPRSDVLSSTILEDCREDESPNNSIEKKLNRKSPVSTNDAEVASATNPDFKYSTITQKLQAQRAQFFTTNSQNNNKEVLPTLETAF